MVASAVSVFEVVVSLVTGMAVQVAWSLPRVDADTSPVNMVAVVGSVAAGTVGEGKMAA